MDSIENNDSLEPVQNLVIVDFKAFANFLRKSCSILLFDEFDENSNNFQIALDQNQESVKKFLSDPQVSTLYVQKNFENFVKGKFKIHTINYRN